MPPWEAGGDPGAVGWWVPQTVACPPASPACIPWQVVVLQDPMQDPNDVLHASHSREKSYIFDVAFDSTATQVGPLGHGGGDVGLGEASWGAQDSGWR